jgi:hypothetical protein
MARDQEATGAGLDKQLNWKVARDAGVHASARVGDGIPNSSIAFQVVGTE